MAGNSEGGKKAARTNKKLHGKDYYRRIGALSRMRNTDNHGFASKEVGPDGLTGPERAKVLGARGGKKSKGKKRATK